MEHKEDEQPNESVYGRRKRILPFVRDTSRPQAQKKHQFTPILVPVPPGESTRGRGYSRGRGGDRGRGRGRGQGKSRGRGRAIPSPATQLPQFREVNPWEQLDHLRERTPQPTTPEPSTPPRPSTDLQPGPSSSHLPSKPPQLKLTHQKYDEWAPGPSTLGPQPPIRPFQGSQRPRKRFRPGKNGQPRHNNQHHTIETNATVVAPSVDQLVPQGTVNTPRSDDSCPPTKRPRIKEEASSSRASLPIIAQGKVVKSEVEEDTAIDLLKEISTSGTKFVSYDNHPVCRFNCGEPPSQVRKHRKMLKGQEIQVLRDQGKEVISAFIRDDGIAIDWIIPTKGELDPLTSKSMLPVIIPDDLEPNFPPLSEATDPSVPPPPTQTLPSHLNPLIVSSDKSDGRRSSTPSTTTEIAYREVPIPSRHLPRDGNTRKLEIWALEQMRLLEAELGSVILPPPELVGIGEYLTGQRIPEGVHPHIKIRYKRTVRTHQPSVETSTNSEETFNLAEFMDKYPATPSGYPSTDPLLPIDSLEPTLPLVTHLETAGSPFAPSSPLPIKSEVDELADNPPSLPASPILSHRTTQTIDVSTPTLIGHTNEPRAVVDEETAQNTFNDPERDSDELQRLRRDLELSKLEAERKHKELEHRILELARKRSEAHTSTPVVEQPAATTRIADEGEPSILPLRRGKYDKTRRLLATTDSTILHVSWLGVMQLVNRDSRRIVATGFGSDAPSSISIEDACSLSPSSTALALSGNESQLAIATLGEENFGFSPLRDRPHDTKGICAIVPVDPQSALTLGHDHRYVHWKFNSDQFSAIPLPLPKLHSCTALAFDPLHSNIVTAGSENNKRSKLTLHKLADPKQIPNTVELSNHPHHAHVDPDNPFLLLLELARLDDQFQVHDIRMPLYQCVQKFGYQNIVHEKAEFRVRGCPKGNYFARGDLGIVRLWDRRSPKSHQTIPVIPHQRVVDVVLHNSSISCATEAHHIVTYPIL
ncbi:unnamed protein product [Rhizoctonia solani]|uniref:Uncharacterized protein n=1 Tax=Rhizoctonia solani TaxID=456999 RepID=A0A8H3B7S5_9AGAM|nr:unnamed protein product [Rhizoctonia solani]